MANDKKFVVKNGLQAPNASFTSPSGANTITVSMLDSGTLSFSGVSGQLFSITDDLSGTIFAVNDISGVPSIEVDDDGTIRFAETFGNILIGTAIDDGTNKLQVNGNTNISGSLTIGGDFTVTGNIVSVDVDTLKVSDNMIYLNSNNTGSNPDLGWAGNYNSGGYAHAGFFRDSTDGVFKAFYGYTPEPDASTEINISHASFQYAPISGGGFYAGTTQIVDSTGNWVGPNSGLVGYTGSQGIQGVIGYTGSRGSTGYTGSQGDQGIQGIQGYTGSLGYTGSRGSTGYTGSKGDQGDQGIQGYTGSQGNIGNTGARGYTGSQGDQGIQGIQGYTGSQGNTGSQGVRGYTGSQGDQGIQGVIGYTGSQGNTGSQGVRGYTGSRGTDGVDGYVGSQGYTGSQGNTGSQGPRGYTGSQGIDGYTGSFGYTGSQGNTGSQGVRGYTGSRGTDGVDGYVGSQGYTGSQGNTGSQGQRGYTGSQGDQGIQGIQGYTGSQGLQGSSGQRGYTGSFGYTGSQGDQGYTGSQGLQGSSGQRGYTGSLGYTGSQGIQGYTGSQGNTGLTGSRGYTGSIGYTGSQGIQGIQGIIGYTGSQGNLGYAGSRGYTGSQGNIGYTGSRGYTGSSTYAYVSDTAPATPYAGMYWFDVEIGKTFIYYNDGNSSQWVDATAGAVNDVVSASFGGTFLGDVAFNQNVSVNGLLMPNSHIVGPINSGADNGKTIGLTTNRYATIYATTFNGTATEALYADVAENYLADADYESGTVLKFGGNEEVTIANSHADERLAGVVTTQPAHLMNSALEGEHIAAIALLGRVPVKVIGWVEKGDKLVSSIIEGYAEVDNNAPHSAIIGKAIQNKYDEGKGMIEVLVGRV